MQQTLARRGADARDAFIMNDDDVRTKPLET